METLSPQHSTAAISELPEAAAPLVIRTFDVGIANRWDEFVFSQPGGGFFQLTGWKRVLEKTFGFEPCYAFAERAGRVTGVAPFFWVSNWVVGKCLISIPFAAYGGICAEDPESEQALLSYMQGLAEKENVDFLELRNRDGGLLKGFHPNNRYATFTIPLAPSPEEALKRLPRDTRYMIRKGEKAGLQTRNGLEQIGQFYQLLAKNFHKLGTPVFPLCLFENLVETFPGKTDLMLVYAGSRPVSGVLSFHFRDTILPYYAGAASDAPKLAASNLMYGELIRQACSAGFRSFDFGRSKVGTGSYAFKTQWNAVIQPLDYQVFLVRRKTVPDFTPLNPRFEMAARLWKRLPPWLATRIGPRLVRWFP
jgi:FemAB-related protein (PEP-CTERM system-associated)